MLNHIALMGRLTRDPELRRTQTGTAVVNFTLAVDRDFGGGADFIDVIAWRNTAEFAEKYLVKGRQAVVSGRLQIREWTDKDGGKRRTAEIVADSIYFADSKKKEATTTETATAEDFTDPQTRYIFAPDDEGELLF